MHLILMLDSIAFLGCPPGCPAVRYMYVTWHDMSIQSGAISVKHSTNMHHTRGTAGRFTRSEVRGQSTARL